MSETPFDAEALGAQPSRIRPRSSPSRRWPSAVRRPTAAGYERGRQEAANAAKNGLEDAIGQAAGASR